jgi:hypothetical protein
VRIFLEFYSGNDPFCDGQFLTTFRKTIGGDFASLTSAVYFFAVPARLTWINVASATTWALVRILFPSLIQPEGEVNRVRN